MEKVLKEIQLNSKKYKLVRYTKDPFHILYSIEGKKETYADLNSIIEHNLLLDAIWVKTGSEEQQIVDSLPEFFENTGRISTSGFQDFTLYNTIDNESE